MIGQPQSHGWRPLLRSINSFPCRQPQSPMSALKGVIKKLQAHQCIEGGIAEGFGMRLAGEGSEPMAPGSMESFDRHRARWLPVDPWCGTDLHRQEVPMLMAMLDRLRQGERRWGMTRIRDFEGHLRLSFLF